MLLAVLYVIEVADSFNCAWLSGHFGQKRHKKLDMGSQHPE